MIKVFLETPEKTLLLSNILNFLFCLVILIYVRFVLQTKTASASRRAFKRLVVFVALCLVADMMSYIFDTYPSEFARLMNHIAMFLAVSLTTFVGFLWNDLFYMLFHIKKERSRLRLYRALWLLPTVVAVSMLIVNLFTGIFYIIDENNVYHRGSLYYVSFFLQYVAFAVAAMRAMLLKVKRPNVPLKREKMRRTVICFGFVVIFFGCLQWVTNGKIAVHCMGLTAGAVIMFVRFLDDQITQDRLTGLNNRYALDTHMIDRVRAYDSYLRSHKLFFVLMDVDGFKEINDSYGHIEGDNALKQLSDALKMIEKKNPRRIFVARYGGDEFAAVLESKDELAVEHFARELDAMLVQFSERCEYKISVSMGQSIYRGREMTIAQWINEADRDLYNKKRASLNGKML